MATNTITVPRLPVLPPVDGGVGTAVEADLAAIQAGWNRSAELDEIEMLVLAAHAQRLSLALATIAALDSESRAAFEEGYEDQPGLGR